MKFFILTWLFLTLILYFLILSCYEVLYWFIVKICWWTNAGKYVCWPKVSMKLDFTGWIFLNILAYGEEKEGRIAEDPAFFFHLDFIDPTDVQVTLYGISVYRYMQDYMLRYILLTDYESTDQRMSNRANASSRLNEKTHPFPEKKTYIYIPVQN